MDELPTPPLLYIHGFASSGHSHKAGILLRHFGTHLCAPTLSHIPELAVSTLKDLINSMAELPVLVGSSLGGFYATYLSRDLGCPAVLINPVTRNNALDIDIVGMQHSQYDDSRFEFTEEHRQALERYAVRPDTSRLLLLAQMGDELLDHRVTIEDLAGAEMDISPGGDHSYQNFASKIGTVREFASRHAPVTT